jgi:hypothetical protein
MAKWYTFAPCHFAGNEAFFGRDSGLYYRGLQQLGHESKVILLGPAFEGDLPGILRATLQELESADWWRALQLDGVIMVAWARHRDTPIVRAIAASGTPLVIHVDSHGTAFPFFRQIETLKTFWRAQRGTHRGLATRSAYFIKDIFRFSLEMIIFNTYRKYRHLRHANVVALTSPSSLKGHQQLCSLFGGKNHGVNLQLTGYPVSENCEWNPSLPKQKRIIAIGRWEDLHHKRPYVLMEVCEPIARLHPDLHIDIFGTKTEALAHWHQALDPDIQDRIHVHGVQPGAVVARALQPAQISFFPSAYEGGPQALFEGLACGVTTVGLNSPDLPGTRFAADYHHADFATRDTPEAFVAALDQGLKKWERGEYSAQQISETWIPKTHVTQLIGTLLALTARAQGEHIKSICTTEDTEITEGKAKGF